MHDYSDEHWFNWQLPYAYDPKAKIKVIDEWLKYALDGDAELIKRLRAFLFATATGMPIQKILEVVGEGGTGKSILTKLLLLLVGKENVCTTSLKELETARFETATLYGKRLTVLNEVAAYSGEVNILKAASGQGTIKI